MSGQINIEPGPPAALWNSDSIRLRNLLESDPLSCGPHVAPASGNSFYTYVKVSNVGTSPIGACSGTLLGAWKEATKVNKTPPTIFPDYALGGSARMESTSVGGTKYLKLIDSNNNQVKTWPAEIVAGFPVYWGWSPDGLFCAVVVPSLVGSYQTPTMEVFVYALSDYKKVDGTNVPAQTEIYYGPHTFKTISEGFSRFSCSWNDRSTALMVTHGYVQSSWLLVAPYVSDSPNNLPLKCYYGYGNIQAGFSPKEGPFTYLFSPNGEFAASYQLPYDKNIYGTMRFYRLRASTRGPYSPARNGITVDVLPNSGSPVTITSLKTGNTAIVLSGVRVPDPQNSNFSLPSVIDNPECLVGQAAEVYVRRNRISTIPNQTDYEKIGASKVAIPPGGDAWVEFPSLLWVNPTGAQNPGQLHYCIQAMGEAPPGDLAPGSLPNAPSWTGFNLSDRHFAQRNIAFV